MNPQRYGKTKARSTYYIRKKNTVKAKAIPVHAKACHAGSMSLSLPDFKTIGS
jgi:hypothetical protein